MAEIKKFVKPDFLEGQSEEEIHKEMLAVITEIIPDMDVTEGSVAWDFTRPTAKEKSRMVNFNLVELIKNMFPMWAYSDNLDNLAYTRGITRKPAVAATGELTITGKIGTIIPDGFIFSTESDLESAAVLFQTVGTHTIDGDDDPATITIPIQAVNAGHEGNVAAGKITLLSKPIKEIQTVKNKQPTTGGVDIEDDEALRQRIIEYDQQQGVSYVGSITDYRRWCMEVTGVGSVRVIPVDDGSGVVTLVVIDANSQPASEELCEEIYNHIMSPDDPEQRIAPVNSKLVVVPPETITVKISATVTTENGVGIEAIRTDFYEELLEYYKTAMAQGIVRINEVSAILIDINGVADFTGLKLNGSTNNISVGDNKMPITSQNDLSGVVI